MSIAIGGNSVSKMYVGSTEITKAYIGSDLVFGGGGGGRNDNYLNFTALEASTISMTSTLATQPTLSYSKDLQTWVTFDANTTISLNAGELVYLKGSNNALGTATSKYTTFAMTGKIEAHGNIMSLLYGDNAQGQLTIPAEYCFCKLFDGCESLVTAPELPATTMKTYCYIYMFRDCTSLAYAPTLPATTLASRCYAAMFYSSGITSAPELPVTTLQTGCYSAMFGKCTSLTTAPDLPATTLVSNCYTQMFDGCTNLNYVKAMFTTTPGSYTRYWLRGVASSGTFVKNASATWSVSGDNGIPSGWTVQTASS